MTIAQTLSFLQNSQGALTTGTINVASGPITLSIASSQKVAVDNNGYLLVGYPSSIGAYSLQVAGNGYFAGNLNITGQVLVNGVALGPGGSGTGGNPSTSTQVQFTNNTQSTGTASGALTINGGLGVGGSVFIGGTLNVGGYPITGSSTNVAISDTPPSGAVTGTLWWDSSVGNLAVYYNDGNSYQWVDAVSALTFPNNVSWLNVTSATISTSTTTGALQITGGVGIGGNTNMTTATIGYNQGRLAIINQQNATVSVSALTSTATTVTSAGFVTYAGAVFANTQTVQIQPSLTGGANTSTASVIVLGGMYVSNTASTISTLTGAVVVAGGVGIGGDLRVGGTVYANTLSVQITTITAATVVVGETFTITNATQSISTQTGALVVTGGVGIGGNINIGGTINFPGFTNFSGTSSAVIVSDTAPGGTLATGTLWWDSSVGTLAIYYNDGNSFQWVDAVSGLTFPNNVSWLTITSSTVSTGTTTGALQVLGGVGIGGTLNANTASILNLTVGYSGSAGAATTGTLRIASTAIAYANISQSLATTSTFSGALISFGGISIANTSNVYVQLSPTGGATTASAALISWGGVYIANTASSTSTLTGALVVQGGIGVGGDVRIQGTLYASTLSVQITTITAATVVVGETFTITNTTPSINTATGALVVTGGVGVGGSLNVGGSVTFSNGASFAGTSSVVIIGDTPPTAPITGTLWWDSSVGNLAIYYNDNNSTQWVDAVSALTFPNNVSWLNVTSATVSTSTITGGLIVTGGLGVGGNANITSATIGYNQGRLAIVNQQNATVNVNSLTSTATTVTSAALVVYGGAVFANTQTVQIQPALTGGATTSTASVIVLGGMYISNTASSTSTLTGAVVVAGGVGIGGDLRVGGTVYASTLSVQITTITAATVVVGEVFTLTNTTAATSTASGALVVTGGVGIGGSVWVGGSINFPNGNSYQGTSSVVIIGDTPPAAPITGTLWWDSSIGTLAIYYNDGNSTQWIDAVSGLTFPNNVSWLNVTSATNSTSTLTGGLIVTGGVGIGQTLFATSATIGTGSGRLNLTQTVPAIGNISQVWTNISTYSGAMVSYGGISIANTSAAFVQPGLGGYPTTASGALVVAGGAYFANTSTATSTVTGAVIIAGGLGVGGNFAWRGLEVISNINYITVSSTAAYGLGTSTTYNVLLVTTGGLTATLTFPTAPVDGQHLIFSVHTNNVTLALTAGPTLSGTFAGAVTAPTTFRYVYRSANTTWYRIQ